MKWFVILLIAGSSINSFAQKRGYDTIPNMPEHYWVRMEKFKKEAVKMGSMVCLA